MSGTQARPAQSSQRRHEAGSLTKVVRGFAALAVANMLGQLIGFAVLAVVARRVGPANLGVYTFAQTFALWWALPAIMGNGVLAIRDIARDPSRTQEVSGELLAVQVCTMSLAVAGAMVSSVWLAPSPEAHTLILIIAAGWLIRSLDLEFVLQARQALGAVAVLTLLGQIVYGVLTPLLVTEGFVGVRTYAWLNQLGYAVTGLGATLVVWRRLGAPRLRVSPRRVVQRYRAGLPLGLPMLIGMMYQGAGAILVGYLRPATDVGLWGAGSKIPMSVFIFVNLWTQAFYPHASVLARTDSARLRAQVGRLSSIFAVLALPLATGATLLGRDLMVAIFGAAFADAGTPFALLMWWVAVNMLSISFSDVLFAAGHELAVARAVAIGAVTCVALGFALIPQLGAAGAALALLAAAVIIFALQVRRFVRVLGSVSIETRRVLGSLVATVLMGAALIALPAGLSVWIRLAVGALVFVAVAIRIGALSRAELIAFARRRPDLAGA